MTRISNKNKKIISFSLLVTSTLFLLPIFIGLGCDNKFSYETSKYNVTGTCKYGFFDIYYLSKNKSKSENRYLNIKAINMQFNNNRAMYIYKVDDSKMLHHRENINFLNGMKYERYQQMHYTEKERALIIKTKNGIKHYVNINNENHNLFD